MKVVKLGAKWCPPCKAYAPVFHKFKEEHPDMIILDIDVDEDKWVVAQLFGVKQIPSTVFLTDEGTYEMVTGVMSLTALNDRLNGAKTDNP